MDMQELELIESEECVTFEFKPKSKQIGIKGKAAAAERAIARIRDHRDQVAILLRERQGIPHDDEEEVERELAVDVPSLTVQRANYTIWFQARGSYYQPSEEELDRMFSALEEGDIVIPDFAHSFSVKKSNGLIVSVDRKGRISQPSPYSPAIQRVK